MTFIDWSDPEEMLGLLLDYVADEASTAQSPERAEFLNNLLGELREAAEGATDSPGMMAIQLRDIFDSQPREFLRDPVMTHVSDCLAELSRLSKDV